MLLHLSEGEKVQDRGTRLRTLMNSKARVEGNENHDYTLTNGHWEVILPPPTSIKIYMDCGKETFFFSHFTY